MNLKSMDKLTEHLDRYFGQNDCLVMHPVVDMGDSHIDVLIYKPNEKYPFWKLVTMGASDYKMPVKNNNAVSAYNEYMMFVHGDEDLTDKEKVSWYCYRLLEAAVFAKSNNTVITWGHSMEWQFEDGEEMCAAFIDFPQIIEDVGVLRCKLGLMKTAACLQVTLLNRNELNKLLEIGPQEFSNYLYPEDGTAAHFISERNRSEKF